VHDRCTKALVPPIIDARATPPIRRKSLKELYTIRKANGKLWASKETLDKLSDNGLLRYRGCRAGRRRFRIMPIATVITTSRPTAHGPKLNMASSPGG